MIGSRNVRRTLVGAATATLMAAGTVAATAPASAVTCKPFTFIGVRGTEDGQQASMGTRLPTAQLAFTQKKGAANVQSDYVSYPASFNYLASMSSGRTALKAKITAYVNGCPSTKIALVGYSQGAHIVGDVVVGLSSTQLSRLQGIGLIGDPMFNSALRGKVSNNSASRGGVWGKRSSWPAGLFVYNVCNTGDLICANDGTNAVASAGVAPHQYYTTTTYSPVAGTTGAYAIGLHVATRS
ncbi:cutinase family protein [Mumia zhuanghuii]|uniref:Cutinase family protein n=2 Tax=Mumia TaxID=1546255 RepID=A0ABW1QKL1_9ACTN|nr:MULTISPECIES: cutinase family protein [Mumia]KAA1418180.1 cutinase family protein [Mumia zhuanghuii]